MSYWLFVSSVNTGTRCIIRLEELSSVVRRSSRTTGDSWPRRMMCLVPVFMLETNNQINNECLPKFVQTDNASSSVKTTIFSAGLTIFSYQLSVEVSLVTMPAKRIIKSSFTFASKRNFQNSANETAANDRDIGGGGVIKMLGVGWGLIEMECPILSFISLRRR